MRRRLAILVLLAAGGVALAAPGADQITTFYAAAFVVPTEQSVTTCNGADGVYTLVHIRGAGPVTSTDARLNGTFEADAMVLTRPDGRGLGFDKLRIINGDGKVVARGLATAMDNDPAEPIKGQVTAKLADGSRLWAMSTVRLPAPGSYQPIVIEFGGAGIDAVDDRAVIVDTRGPCAQQFFDAYYD